MIEPYYENGGITIYHGEAVDTMRALPDDSVDIIVADPPYFKVKESFWDNAWKTPDEFLAWLDTVLEQFQRVLKPNGSLYLFASPKMSARVEVLTMKRLNVLNRIRWLKSAGWHQKADKKMIRGYLSPWEEIVFAEHYGSDNAAMNGAGYDAKCDELRGFVFEPLRAYLSAERDRAGWTTRKVAEAFQKKTGSRTVTGMAGHWFETVQWSLPTEKNYHWLRDLFGKPYLRREYEELRREYEELRREYEELRREYEELRRPFNLTARKQFTDVWEFTPVMPYNGKHECEKPPALYHHILDVSTRPGAVVLDPFLGSGRSLEVAKDMGLTGIGIEFQENWCRRASEKLNQYSLFGLAA